MRSRRKSAAIPSSRRSSNTRFFKQFSNFRLRRRMSWSIEYDPGQSGAIGTQSASTPDTHRLRRLPKIGCPSVPLAGPLGLAVCASDLADKIRPTGNGRGTSPTRHRRRSLRDSRYRPNLTIGSPSGQIRATIVRRPGLAFPLFIGPSGIEVTVRKAVETPSLVGECRRPIGRAFRRGRETHAERQGTR
jgi:hypothetical protein